MVTELVVAYATIGEEDHYKEDLVLCEPEEVKRCHMFYPTM